MKRLLAFLSLAIAICFPALTANADVHIGDYFRSLDTYMQSHYQSDSDDNLNNNWSTYPTAIPYTELPVLAARGIGGMYGLVGAGIGVVIAFIMTMVRGNEPRQSDTSGESADD